MFNKLLVISGFLVLYLIPKTMRYESNTPAMVSNYTMNNNLSTETKNELKSIKVPKIIPQINLEKKFYEDDEMNFRTNNLLLVASNVLTLSGIAFAEIDNLFFIIKSRKKFGKKELLVQFIKRL